MHLICISQKVLSGVKEKVVNSGRNPMPGVVQQIQTENTYTNTMKSAHPIAILSKVGLCCLLMHALELSAWWGGRGLHLLCTYVCGCVCMWVGGWVGGAYVWVFIFGCVCVRFNFYLMSTCGFTMVVSTLIRKLNR